MLKEQDNTPINDFDDEIDLREVFNALLEGKWIIISFTAFISIIGVIYSLLLPNIYESKAMLVPVDSSNDSISSALGSYSGLASMAGIQLPSKSNQNNSSQAKHKISSLSFFKNNIMPNIDLAELMAVKSWEPQTNTLVFNNEIYDTKSNTWVRDYSYPQKQIPSAQESFEEFKKHIILEDNKKAGFFSVSIKHQSPFVAQKWVELVVNEVNDFYREKDRSESEIALRFLNKQISMTNLSEIKQLLAMLLQEEVKTLTLIEAKEFYVFDYIDPPDIMELKSEPKRALICIIFVLLGGCLSIIFVLLRHYVLASKTS